MLLTITEQTQRGRELALEHRISPGTKRCWNRELRRFADKSRHLQAFCRNMRSTYSSHLLGSEEWLLDHADFIAEQTVLVQITLKRQAGNRLPMVKQDEAPRLILLAKAYFDATDGSFSEDSWVPFVNAYQEILPLTLNELWLLPFAMRLALISRLDALSTLVEERREAIDKVDRWLMAQLRVNQEHRTGERLHEEIHLAPETSGPILATLVSRMNSGQDDSDFIRSWLSTHLGNTWARLDAIVGYEHDLRTRYQVSIGNAVSSLRDLNRLNWRLVFKQISLVEHIFRSEPTDTYPFLDFSSQDAIRKAVERIAMRWSVPEHVVAESAVTLAEESQTRDLGKPYERPQFLAYYLLEASGLRALKKRLDVPTVRPAAGVSLAGSRKQSQYFTLIGAVFTCLALLMMVAVGDGTWLNSGTIFWVALFCVFPASEWAVAFVHWMVECTISPQPLLRYDFSEGIPKDATTMVVVPVIWSSPQEVVELTEKLELHHVSTRDRHVHYALLGDFRDGVQQTEASDDDVLQMAKHQIEQLNRRYAKDGSTFHLFHRERIWNDGEQSWMGWERKRGKLVEFVELLRGNEHTSYSAIVGDRQRVADVRYVVTLDTDTTLPLGTVQRMVGTMHLPYNRPRLNQQGTRVLEGYGILQPRVGVRHDAATRSWLARLWSGNPGIDPYAFALSDPYQDAFGEGIFTGKGIFDVDVFHQVLCPRIPDNRVLSHDLLEGGFLRAGLLSDVEVMDEYPTTFAAYQLRLERWIRGDWQLSVWLKRKLHDRFGRLQPIDLGPLTRWQIIDNMRRSLLQPALFVTLLAGICLLPGNATAWTIIVFLTLAIPLIRHCASVSHVVRHPAGLGMVFLQTLFTVLFLPVQTAFVTSAIARALYRLFISKRRLLEWVSSAEIERQTHKPGKSRIHGLFGAYAVIAVFAGFIITLSAGVNLAIGVTMTVVWALAPVYAVLLDRPWSVAKVRLNERDRAELIALAADTWAFYQTYAGRDDNYLPPDNVQIDPPVGIAHRTSPTNIAMLMTAYVAAVDNGFIEIDAALQGLNQTLATMERMEKWHGHLYNWYDTQTLAPLSPKYVSTVDSGNLVAALLVVVQALQEWLADDGATNANLVQSLLERMDTFITATDFRPLYDAKAGLLTLGYHVDDERRETILYDLMASEARQASFVAIALGQVPASHWFQLNRTLTKIGRIPTLLSWSATMFEYLMPALFMRTYQGTLWAKTYEGVIRRQKQYALERRMPFGISESGYYAFDSRMNYQYKAFGVPGLGFKRGLEQDLVLAPYATALCLSFDLDGSLANLRQMQLLGARGQYGFFEAIDCTPERIPPGVSHKVIRSYMAHHQGMTLLALTNVLHQNVMVERFHRDVRVKAAEVLLQERIPAKPKIIPNPTAVVARLPEQSPASDALTRTFDDANPTAREVCLLSNGHLLTVVDTLGCGFTQYGDLLVNRWRNDPLATHYGSFLYLHDRESGETWSPIMRRWDKTDANRRVTFQPHLATFQDKRGSIESALTVCVSPEFQADVRILRIVNRGTSTRRVEVTSFLELALAHPAADKAHPAFSKLFVETEFDARTESLVAHRRPRSTNESTLYAAHAVVVQQGVMVGTVEYETDRAKFVGRGHNLDRPRGIARKLAGSTGAVADPSFSIRRTLELAPEDEAIILIATAVDETRTGALQALERLATDKSGERTIQLAWNRSQVELGHLQLMPELVTTSELMASSVLYRSRLSDVSKQAIMNNRRGQSGLWSIGISGDLPVILLEVATANDIPFVTTLVRCHQFLRLKGLRVDLVILSATAGGYNQTLHNGVLQVVERFSGPRSIRQPGGVHILAKDELDEAIPVLLRAMAQVRFEATSGSLRGQLETYTIPTVRLPNTQFTPAAIASDEGAVPIGSASSLSVMQGGNGYGSFSDEGNEYQIELDGRHHLPLPWSNIMANPEFGTLVTELGTGYTWWRNSREFKLTPWRNDPVVDIPSEVCYLRDEDTGIYWSTTPAPVGAAQHYRIRHGHGYTVFEQQVHDLAQTMTIFTARCDAAKIVTLSVENRTEATRNLSVTYFLDWVLGVDPDANRGFVVCDWISAEDCMVARNQYEQGSFQGSTAVLGVAVPENQADGRKGSWTSSRTEFLGPFGRYDCPHGMGIEALSGFVGPTANACGAIRQPLTLGPSETKTIVIVLGAAHTRQAAVALWRKYRQPEAALAELRSVKSEWRQILSAVTVDTPSPELNVMLNGWLLYQALSCRIWARTGFYQAGGAVGFRDQLQDSLALLHADSALVKKQILLHARHQFLEGDVQHWWHEETGKGIRTRFSDDLLWLPYAVARYVEHTGDISILSEEVPYLVAEPLNEGEDERYGDTRVADVQGTIYEHCIRAVEKSLRLGEHGIPLMGSGDWNDGMNLVGPKGRGESVWLGWFLCEVLDKMQGLSEMMGDLAAFDKFQKFRQDIASALNHNAWDGQWYRRAFTDDGTWIGSARDTECRIDAIAQAWSVISGAGDEVKAQRAMQAFLRELVDPALGIALLLTPPFDSSAPSPGYIQGYPGGLRENGGQYTHGVVWAVMAFAMLGEGSQAYALYHMLMPANHTRTEQGVDTYQGEPYVMAADVYAKGPLAGRAGWTWYTGAAGWMYQVGLEWILGVRRHANRLLIQPAIPSTWPGFSIAYRYGSTVYHITVEQRTEGQSMLVVDGETVELECSSVASVQTSSGKKHLSSDDATTETASGIVATEVETLGVPAALSLPLVDDGKSHDVKVLWMRSRS